MKIKNPNNLPTIKVSAVRPLQGGLKDLSKENYSKLKSVLEKRGFEVPLFLWFQDDTPYLLDGHQRHRVIMTEHPDAEVPYLTIDAADEKEAKQKLLEITSQYGRITQEGFDEFIVDLPEAEILEAVNFDALSLNQGEHTPDENQDTCPECGQKLKGNFRNTGTKQVA